jgi:hypothetical protein
MELTFEVESEIEKSNHSLRSLIYTDPERHEDLITNKKYTNPEGDLYRVADKKDEILKGSCDWVFQSETFNSWWTKPNSHLLWIKGDPGKGKTMIAMAAIARFRNNAGPQPRATAFFFFDNDYTELTTAAAALRGLVYLLLDQHMSLVRHLRKHWDRAGDAIYKGTGAFDNLRQILSDIVQDPSCPSITFVVDAIDECRQQQSDMLTLIDTSPRHFGEKVKWLVTSRNEQTVKKGLRSGHPEATISLELYADNVEAAVSLYIDTKVKELSALHEYHRHSNLEQDVKTYLEKNADGTFLWVALVCQELWKVDSIGHTMSILIEFPRHLQSLYRQMIERISQRKRHYGAENDDRVQDQDDEHRKLILTFLSISCRPPTVYELGSMAGIPSPSIPHLTDLIRSCGSFLTIRGEVVSFVHLSASEFFTKHGGFDLLGVEPAAAHHDVFVRSHSLMRRVLKQNICQLDSPGVFVGDAISQINKSLPQELEYPCCFWIDHLWHAYEADVQKIALDRQAMHLVLGFVEFKLLNWLEALSIMGNMSEGLRAISMLRDIPAVSLIHIDVRVRN